MRVGRYEEKSVSLLMWVVLEVGERGRVVVADVWAHYSGGQGV